MRTPGPWTVDNYGGEPAIRTDGGIVICPRVWGGIEDARLIAAAPELLAACKSFLNVLPESSVAHDDLGMRAVAGLIAMAVAKVEGPPKGEATHA